MTSGVPVVVPDLVVLIRKDHYKKKSIWVTVPTRGSDQIPTTLADLASDRDKLSKLNKQIVHKNIPIIMAFFVAVWNRRKNL